MATTIENLLARKAYLTNLLANTTLLTVGGKPNAMTADGGTTVDHEKARAGWYRELKEINELIIAESAVQAAVDGTDPGWEVVSEGYAG